MTVLAKSIQADYILLLESLEGLGLYFLSIEFLILELFTSILCCLLLVLLLLLMISLQLVLLFLLLQDGLIVFNGLFKCLIKETAVIDEGHGHIATKTRHLFEMHPLFTHNLFDKAMFESFDDVFFFLFLLFLLTSCGRLSLIILLIKDLMGDRCLFCGEHAVDHKLMSGTRMHELDDFGSFCVLVSRIIGIVLNLSGGVYELADVDTLSLGLPLDKVDQLLEVILEVSACLKLLNKGFTLTLHMCGR